MFDSDLELKLRSGSKRRNYIKQLTKRRDHLIERTNTNPALSFDRTEKVALDWAIALMQRDDADRILTALKERRETDSP